MRHYEEFPGGIEIGNFCKKEEYWRIRPHSGHEDEPLASEGSGDFIQPLPPSPQKNHVTGQCYTLWSHEK